MTPEEALVAALEAERGASKKTLEQLATATGFSYQSVQRYLSGKRQLRADVIWKLAEALDVSVSDLYRDAERRLAKAQAAEGVAPVVPFPNRESQSDTPPGVQGDPASEYESELRTLGNKLLRSGDSDSNNPGHKDVPG